MMRNSEGINPLAMKIWSQNVVKGQLFPSASLDSKSNLDIVSWYRRRMGDPSPNMVRIWNLWVDESCLEVLLFPSALYPFPEVTDMKRREANRYGEISSVTVFDRGTLTFLETVLDCFTKCIPKNTSYILHDIPRNPPETTSKLVTFNSQCSRRPS